MQVKVFFQQMKEPEQGLERSKSADDVVGDNKYRKHDDFSQQSRSHTSDQLFVPPQRSHASHKHGAHNNHTLEERYHLLTTRNLTQPGRREATIIDTGSLEESVEAVSLGGFSDNDQFEDDLSDTETDNEWEGCEVTHV